MAGQISSYAAGSQADALYEGDRCVIGILTGETVKRLEENSSYKANVIRCKNHICRDTFHVCKRNMFLTTSGKNI